MDKKESEVYRLRVIGHTYEEIASKCGYASASGAWQAYKRATEEMIFESAEEVRQLELLRLDDMTAAIWPSALAGDLPSINVVLKIMDRRAKLLGLDKPEKVEINKWDLDYSNIDEEVQKIIQIMNEREDEFMLRREAEVRNEMRVQFEMEKRLEKELAQKANMESAKASILAFLDAGDDHTEKSDEK